MKLYFNMGFWLEDAVDKIVDRFYDKHGIILNLNAYDLWQTNWRTLYQSYSGDPSYQIYMVQNEIFQRKPIPYRRL